MIASSIRLASAAGAAFALVLVASPSRADDAPPAEVPVARAPFGAKGDFVLADIFGLHIQAPLIPESGAAMSYSSSGWISLQSYSTSTTNSSVNPNGSQLTLIGVAPSIDWFVADGFSVGGRLGASYFRSRTTMFDASNAPYDDVLNGYTLSVAPRVGRVFTLADDVYFWPRAGVSIGGSHGRDDAGTSVSTTFDYGASLDLGFALRLGRRAMLDLGPILSASHTTVDQTGPLGGSAQTTSVSASFAAAIDVTL